MVRPTFSRCFLKRAPMIANRAGSGNQESLSLPYGTEWNGLAVPDTEKFIKQCDKLSSRVREDLNIFILLVNSSGQVQIVAPNENVPS